MGVKRKPSSMQNRQKKLQSDKNLLFEMDATKSHSQEFSSSQRKILQEIVTGLTAPGKILIQINGWRNVCQTLEYIFGNWCDLFDNLCGISFDYGGLSQVVGNVCAAENLKKKVLLGVRLNITISSYKLDDERNAEFLEGFDDLDRNLKKLSIWGCSFVILQVKLGCIKPFGARHVPFDDSEYFGIFSATTQCLGMVPIIQFQHDLSDCGEEDCACAFVDAMYNINQALFDFEVDISCLLISPLISYPLKAFKDQLMNKSENLINSLKHALPPAIGGVVFASQGSYKALGLLIDQLSKIINRIPWPIICCYEWKLPNVLDSDLRDLIFEKWFKKQRLAIKVLCRASEGNLISWKGKVTVGIPDYITTHDYYDKEYEEARLKSA